MLMAVAGGAPVASLRTLPSVTRVLAPCSGGALSNTDTVGITVTPVNDPPVIFSDIAVDFVGSDITTSANGAASVFAADVDGDGDTDVLSASSDDDTIAWYENDGAGNFTTHTITTSADAAYSVFAADVDGDGDMDVLSATNNTAVGAVFDTIAWYENDGNQNFTTHVITTSAKWVLTRL